MTRTFADLPLLDTLRQTLAEQGLTTLTPIQDLALEALLAGTTGVCLAETGSGKTLTYVLPILDRLKRLEDDGNPTALAGEPRALVIVPTRELGEQVKQVFKTFTHHTRLRVRATLGGRPLRRSRDRVKGTFEVLVATPGRLGQLLERDAISLEALRIVAMDEVDQLLEPSFGPQVLAMVGQVPGRPQTILCSALLPQRVRDFVDDLYPQATWFETEGSEEVVDTLITRHVDVPDGRRYDHLGAILAEPTDGATLLFANTRDQCDRVAEEVRRLGWSCEVLRGALDAVIRREHMRGLRDGTYDMLVCTDMAGRGLDVPHVSRVVNVHLPQTMETYLHRVGRTARAGREGLVVNLVTPRDAPLIEALDDGHEAPVYRGPR